MEITGKKGRITVQVPFKPGIREKVILDKGGQKKTMLIKGMQLYSGEVHDIEDAINHGIPPKISLAESRGNIAVIEALYQSAKLSTPVKI
jgi:predicted dehydrogenase